MIETCPECGSNEIIPDLLVFADEALIGQHPPYMKFQEPKPEKTPFLWSPKSVASGFRAAICGDCGFTRIYSKKHADLLQAHKKGYTSLQYDLKIVPI